MVYVSLVVAHQQAHVDIVFGHVVLITSKLGVAPLIRRIDIRTEDVLRCHFMVLVHMHIHCREVCDTTHT